MKDKHNKKGIVTAEYVSDNMLNTTIPGMSKGIQPFAAANTSGLLASLQALNPLQHIATSIAQICHYKQQVKALETEQLRIKQQAQVMHHQIDAQLEIRIKELDEQGQH